MSISYADQKIVKIKVEVGKSKLNPKKYIYILTLDDNELFGKPIISMKVGTTYVFEINAPRFPFYITSDSKGGGFAENENYSMRGGIEIPSENAYESGNVGMESGTLTWTPQFIHKDMGLYYQCNFVPNMGNVIKISLN